MARWFVDRLPQRGLPSVSLRRLLPEAHFTGCADWKVFGCADDHRRLEPGQVFRRSPGEHGQDTTGTSSSARLSSDRGGRGGGGTSFVPKRGGSR